ncbi:hypothetical protein EC968_007810 [Mortierella alpina]|nr:hypothetical protein EC968_007810 [Mortierella alpina]
MSDDFPFTFGDASDEDEGSAGLFCAPKTKNTTRIRTPAEQEPYYAQIDEDGWFHHTGKSVRELMMHDKNGANKVKMRADHYYMLHRYQEAYEIAKEYCEIVASNDVRSVQGDGGMSRRNTTGDAEAIGVLKVTDSKELQEMAIRCALKLGKTEEAAKLADELRRCGINLDYASEEGGAAMDAATQDAAAQSRLAEYQRKVVLPAQDALRMLKSSSLGDSKWPVEKEVVEYIVAAWDAQLIAPSPVAAAEDDEDDSEARARDK